MAFKFSDPSKVDGYLIAGLEVQRDIIYRHHVFIPLTDLHDIVMVFYGKNRSYYQQEAKDITMRIIKEKRPAVRYMTSKYFQWGIQHDSEVEQLISRKVKDYLKAEKVQVYLKPSDYEVDEYCHEILYG